jgi:hypothetical protein
MGLLTLAMTPAKAASLLTRAVIRRQCPAFGGGPEFQVAGLPQGRAWAAIPCRKSETKVSLLHEHCILFACRIVGPPFRRRVRDDKSERKNRRAKISCNPLISLVSDERIQGNPRKSKEIQGNQTPKSWGFRKQKGPFQENPNRVDKRRRGDRREGAEPTRHGRDERVRYPRRAVSRGARSGQGGHDPGAGPVILASRALI